MSWLTLTVDADAAYAESLSESLLELGALSVDLHDAHAGTIGEQPVFGEPDEPPRSLWAHNRITALFRQMFRLKRFCARQRKPPACQKHPRTT